MWVSWSTHHFTRAASVFYWTNDASPEERLARIEVQCDWLEANRGAKKPSEIVKTTSQGSLSNKAFREVSNRGQDQAISTWSFQLIASSILADLAGEKVELQWVYTPALLLDAKFTYSSILLERLRHDTIYWEPRPQLTYNPKEDPLAGLSTMDRLMMHARLGANQ